MAPQHRLSRQRGPGPRWLAPLVALLVVGLAVVIGALILSGTAPLTHRSPVQVDIDLPQPMLPDAPRLPEAPVVPPVDPRVGSSPAAVSPN